jgi:hypothetical protein
LLIAGWNTGTAVDMCSNMHILRLQNTPAVLWFDLGCVIWICCAISSHFAASKPCYVDFAVAAS